MTKRITIVLTMLVNVDISTFVACLFVLQIVVYCIICRSGYV